MKKLQTECEKKLQHITDTIFADIIDSENYVPVIRMAVYGTTGNAKAIPTYRVYPFSIHKKYVTIDPNGKKYHSSGVMTKRGQVLLSADGKRYLNTQSNATSYCEETEWLEVFTEKHLKELIKREVTTFFV
jgi:hypothetical protein